MRTHALLAPLAPLALAAALVGGPIAAEAAATTEIIQQRTSDGRVLLTDRPSAGAKTERSWRLEAEDPAAARKRALDVQIESQLVSERIERRIAMQQRLLDQDMERQRLALERQRRVAYDDDDDYAGGLVVFAPGYLRGSAHRHHGRLDDRPGRGGRDGRDGRYNGGAPRGSRFTGPGAPGSR